MRRILMKKTIDTEDYFYINSKGFIEDDETMKEEAVGVIVDYLDTKEFEDCVLQRIISYAGEPEVGYPDESNASIERAFKKQKERVLVMVKNHILRTFGFSSFGFPYTGIVDFLKHSYKIAVLALGCVEGREGDFTEYVKSEEFANDALRSIKAYNSKIDEGYPFETEEEIEAAVAKYKIVDAMRKCIGNAKCYDDLIA